MKEYLLVHLSFNFIGILLRIISLHVVYMAFMVMTCMIIVFSQYCSKAR